MEKEKAHVLRVMNGKDFPSSNTNSYSFILKPPTFQLTPTLRVSQTLMTCAGHVLDSNVELRKNYIN